MQTDKKYFKAFKYKAWANVEMLSYGERQLHLLPLAEKTFFLRILNHTAVVDSLFISRISGTTEMYAADNTVETPALSELRERMSKNDAWLIGYAETATSDELDRCISFRFTDGDRGQLSVGEIFLHLLTHGSNHRGMAARVLASNNLDRPKDTFTRFLHQLEPLRRESTETPIAKLEG